MATWVISKCAVTPNRVKSDILVALQVVVVETLEESKALDEEEEVHRANVNVRQVTEDVTTGNSVTKDDFYVFYTGETDDGNTLKLEIADKTINVIIDSGASRNLMSEEVFNLVTGSNVKLLECNKRDFAYASEEPLQIKGKCNLEVRV